MYIPVDKCDNTSKLYVRKKENDTGNPKPALRDSLEVWDGEESGREVQEGGDIHVPNVDSCWCMAKVITQCCRVTIF